MKRQNALTYLGQSSHLYDVGVSKVDFCLMLDCYFFACSTNSGQISKTTSTAMWVKCKYVWSNYSVYVLKLRKILIYIQSYQ